MQENNNNIVLIGMMGAGKTYIGAKLSKLLAHFSYIDIDKEIEKQEGKTISQIFQEDSEQTFRKLEAEMIKKVCAQKNQILSIGGGAFENPSSRNLLKKNGIVFFLNASAEVLFERLKNDTKRPLLSNNCTLEKIKELLKKRKKNYLKAHFVIDTNGHQAYTILNDIIKGYEEYAANKSS